MGYAIITNVIKTAVSQLQQQHQLHRLSAFNGKSGTKLTFAIAEFVTEGNPLGLPILPWTQYSELEDWQSWRRTSAHQIAAFSAEPPAESPINLPKNRGEIVKIANKKR